jgi:hypothetical protein
MSENGELLSIIHPKSFPFIFFRKMDASSQHIANGDEKTDERTATNIVMYCHVFHHSPLLSICFQYVPFHSSFSL